MILTMSQTDYINLKSKFITHLAKFDKEIVSFLISKFKNDIASPRRFGCVKTPSELMNILEKRERLSQNNLQPLMTIAKSLHSDHLLNLLNHGKENNLQEDLTRLHIELSDTMRSKNRAIRKELERRLGDYWTKFASQFDVQEREIDVITKKSASSEERAIHLMLNRIEELHPDFNDRLRRIKGALDKIRRDELKRAIEDIEYSNTFN